MAQKKYVSLNRLSDFLDNLKNKFATITHKHKIADITDYKVDTELSSTSTNPVQNKVLDAEFDAVSNALSALELAIDGKASSTHDHPDKYYEKSEIDTKLSGKSDSTHHHDNKYDAKGSAAAVQTNLNTVSDTLGAHTENSNIHVTTANKTDWNSAYTHSTSAHARVDATKVEDSTTNGNIKINGTETNVYSHPNSGVSAGTYKSVTVNAQGHVTGGSNPTTLAGYGITDAEPKGTASSAVSTHNTSTSAHGDIRDLITGLTTRLNTLANSDDTTLDQLSEIVAYIKNNKSLIDGVTTNKVNVADIINDLTTNITNKPLSAAQGVEIKKLINDLQADLDGHGHTVSEISDLTATATELNYMDGVTSNVQAQLDSKVDENHTHSWEDLDDKPFYETEPVNMVIVPALTFNNWYYESKTTLSPFVAGQKGTVTYDGTTYNNVECKDNGSGIVVLGSVDRRYNDYPFAVYISNGYFFIDTPYTSGSVTHTIQVTIGVTDVVKLDKKFLPNFAGEVVSNKTFSGYEEVGGTFAEIFNDYKGNIATGDYAHAEGKETKALGDNSHAEGKTTTASGVNSHVEGEYSEAKGSASHAEGYSCTTEAGYGNHSEGFFATSKGTASHAEGYYTIAGSDMQHVQGQYNIEDTSGKYAHIVGNGAHNARSNAHTLDWDGNAWFAGDIFVGGTSQDDTSASKIVTKADQRWNLIYDSGEISAIANSISNINVSGYTNIQVLVRIYNDGDSINSRAGSAIFKAQNGKSYQFPVWSNMFSKSINTVYTMATFNLVDGWLVCPCATRLIGDVDMFAETEGGTAGSLVPTGSGMMRCTSPLSTLTISSLDQNSNYYFGMGSRVMVWGWN